MVTMQTSSRSVFGGSSETLLCGIPNAQNPLHAFPRNFPVDGEVANLSRGLVRETTATHWQQVVVMEFGKRHDTTDTTDFCSRQLVTDLLRGN